MKKYIAVIAALMISLHYCISAIPTMAGQSESSTANSDLPQSEDLITSDAHPSQLEEPVPSDTPDAKDCSLQIPENLDIFLDPWEINGKGQIYSETYVIRNTGEETVAISLSGIVCTPGRNSGTQVKTNKKKLRENKKKNLYIEMVFEDGTKIAMSEKGSKYQTELEPGESLSVYFTGALNEGSSKEWKNGDIRLFMKCSWIVEEQELTVDQIDKTDEGTEKNGEVSPTIPDMEKKEDEEMAPPDGDTI